MEILPSPPTSPWGYSYLGTQYDADSVWISQIIVCFSALVILQSTIPIVLLMFNDRGGYIWEYVGIQKIHRTKNYR
jgi:hypothetical protein